MSAIQTRLLSDLQAQIQALDLTGSTGATGDIGQNIFVQLLNETLNITTWPAVLLSVEGEAEEEQNEAENFEEDCVTYPVKILLVDTMRPGYQKARDDYYSWRHAIAQALRGLVNYPLLTNTPECHVIYVRNLPIVTVELKRQQFVVCGVVALCHTNESRVRV